MLGLASCSRVRCLRISGRGVKPGSRPAYLRRRRTAAGRRESGVWGESRVWEAAKDGGRGVDERDFVGFGVILGAEIEVEGFFDDGHVLADAGVLFGGHGGADFFEFGLGFGALDVLVGKGGVGDEGVKLGEALGGAALGAVLEADGEEALGVGVGGGDPGGGGGGLGGGLGGGEGKEEGGGEG